MMLCSICKDNDVKYKCPRCFIRYCSLTCYKSHKEVCSAEGKPSSSAVITSEARSHVEVLEPDEEADKVSPEVLARLGESKELISILHNPHLQKILKHLDSTETPDVAMETSMQEPIFTEFVDVCLGLVEPQPNIPCG